MTYTVTNALVTNHHCNQRWIWYISIQFRRRTNLRQRRNFYQCVNGITHGSRLGCKRDVNGYSCGVEDIEDVQIIDYPHYFTPNGDGIHDTWNIAGLGDYAQTTTIYIFDRYGSNY
ncbi:MAG: T9SS type B sorting domain-containing protein [Flavobacterium sp.]|uniref:T9SS type B sorting domain-containing protein n=1 Tax=Flavobacterium sp. TaxID=239 RepID=UPI0035275228